MLLFFSVAQCHDGAGDVAEDAGGGAAQKEAFEAAAAVGAHDDDVGVLVFGGGDDLAVGGAESEDGVDFEVVEIEFLQEAVEHRFDLFAVGLSLRGAGSGIHHHHGAGGQHGGVHDGEGGLVAPGAVDGVVEAVSAAVGGVDGRENGGGGCRCGVLGDDEDRFGAVPGDFLGSATQEGGFDAAGAGGADDDEFCDVIAALDDGVGGAVVEDFVLDRRAFGLVDGVAKEGLEFFAGAFLDGVRFEFVGLLEVRPAFAGGIDGVDDQHVGLSASGFERGVSESVGGGL